MQFFGGSNLLIVLARVEGIPLRYTTLPPKQLLRHKFFENYFSQSNQYNQQKYKKLAQKDNQRSETGLTQTSPRYSLLIVVVRDDLASFKITFFISHLAFTLSFSIMDFGEKMEQIKKILLHRHKQ